jgi:putative amide transporter protein
MGDVGLLLIGAVLLVNGLGLLGHASGRSAAPLNLLVGGAQLVLPTLGLVLEHGNPGAAATYAPIYLFGFTYVWVGVDALRGDSGKAFGFFSGFVAVVAVLEGLLALRTDPAFAASWWLWALMWGGFFALQGLGITRLGGASLPAVLGWLLILGGQLSATVPGLLRLEAAWPGGQGWFVVLVLVAAALGVALSWALGRAGVGVSAGDAAGASGSGAASQAEAAVAVDGTGPTASASAIRTPEGASASAQPPLHRPGAGAEAIRG